MAEKKKDEKLPEVPAIPKQPSLSPELEQKLQQVKTKLDHFQKEILKKFDKYIMSVSVLPPPRPEQLPPGAPPLTEEEKNAIRVVILVDDSDSKTMTKYELQQRLQTIISATAKEIDKTIVPDVLLLSELWQNCYDGKYDVLQMIAMSAPLFDNGMLQAIKIAEVHKSMVLRKFEKYIVSYVLAGSLVQGRATKTSDIDVWIVIDDTDVKKMTRVELRDKLRAIIIGMGIEAGEITGVKNKINIQVYILTDFWDSLKEANPIIFTLLRDGVPFFDRGVFMPWKLLLKMGKIKPSAEAIDLFMSSGDQMLERISYKLKEVGMEDTYYAILTPSQAALMMFGIPPPTPRETPELMREIFVQKEKMLESSYVDILEKNIKIRKDIEHGLKKELTGKEIDELIENAKKYLKRIKKLFTEIESIKSEQDIVHIHDSVVTLVRDALKTEGVEKVTDAELAKSFDDTLVATGKIPVRELRILKGLLKAKKDYDTHKLEKKDIEKVKKDSREFIKSVIEYIQRKRGRELDRAKIRVTYGDKKYGEVYILGTDVFVIHDAESEKKTISKGTIRKDGRINNVEKSSLEAFEKMLSAKTSIDRTQLKPGFFEDLQNLFGKDIEIMMM